MYHYEDLLKAEQKDLECDLVSLLERNTGVYVRSSPKRAKQGVLLSYFWKLSPLSNVSDPLPCRFYSAQFSLHSFFLLPGSLNFCFLPLCAVYMLVYKQNGIYKMCVYTGSTVIRKTSATFLLESSARMHMHTYICAHAHTVCLSPIFTAV